MTQKSHQLTSPVLLSGQVNNSFRSIIKHAYVIGVCVFSVAVASNPSFDDVTDRSNISTNVAVGTNNPTIAAITFIDQHVYQHNTSVNSPVITTATLPAGANVTILQPGMSGLTAIPASGSGSSAVNATNGATVFTTLNVAGGGGITFPDEDNIPITITNMSKNGTGKLTFTLNGSLTFTNDITYGVGTSGADILFNIRGNCTVTYPNSADFGVMTFNVPAPYSLTIANAGITTGSGAGFAQTYCPIFTGDGFVTLPPFPTSASGSVVTTIPSITSVPNPSVAGFTGKIKTGGATWVSLA